MCRCTGGLVSHGNMVAHYKLEKPLGRGGMAEVYEAIDINDQQPVAIKLLLPHLAAEDIIRKRFLREANVGIELDHPGIVKVYEVGESENRPYIAMELIQGRTLEELLKTTSFNLEQNYPNPFNPSTTITYSLPFESNVNIVVYNLIGEVVRELENSTQLSGEYSLRFDGFLV